MGRAQNTGKISWCLVSESKHGGLLDLALLDGGVLKQQYPANKFPLDVTEKSCQQNCGVTGKECMPLHIH
jgi:hypothetical protein